MSDGTATHRQISTTVFTLAALVVALFLAGVVSFAASSSPDGLRYVAEQTGFGDAAQEHALADGLFAEYATASLSDTVFSGALAGLVGCAVTFGLAAVLGLALRRRRAAASSTA